MRTGGQTRRELVMLANAPDARSYLGCVLDGEGMVREWLQICVQNLDDFAATETRFEGQVSSVQMDERWRRYWETVHQMAPGMVILQVPESQWHPLYLDPVRGCIVRPTTREGTEWKLCRDDKVLEAAGLPKYSQSVSRYLSVSDKSGANRFVAADAKAPLKEVALTRAKELGFESSWLSVNPQGGPMIARIHSPLDFEDYVELLGGATIAQVSAKKRDCEAALLRTALAGAGQDGRRHGLLFSGSNGAELFYLKLRLLLQAGRGLQTHLRQQGCPLLNLEPASFGVFPGVAGELPWPWTTTCELVRPGRAVAFKIPNSSEVRFVAVGESGSTIYCPAGRSRRSDLIATLRPDKILVDQQRLTIEGRLQLLVPEPVDTADIVRFRFSEGPILDDFCGAVLTDGPAQRKEISFRTWPRIFTPEEIAQLRKFEGGKVGRCWSELIPALSSPYDLNSLSILGARALLVHEKNPVGKVADQLEELGRSVSEQLPEKATLEQTMAVVERLLTSNAGREALASIHVLGSLSDVGKDPDWLPTRLWAGALAVLLRLMPGLGSVSQCADYGAAPAGGLHTPLDEPLAALEGLCARARSLVFCDWNANCEVRAILLELRENW
jgi:hypothetical protein